MYTSLSPPRTQQKFPTPPICFSSNSQNHWRWLPTQSDSTDRSSAGIGTVKGVRANAGPPASDGCSEHLATDLALMRRSITIILRRWRKSLLPERGRYNLVICRIIGARTVGARFACGPTIVAQLIRHSINPRTKPGTYLPNIAI